MMNWHKKAVIIGVLVIAAMSVLIMTDMGDGLTLSQIQASALSLREQAETHYIASVFIFIVAYVAVNLWLPAAAVLTLLAGFLFGTVAGAVYVTAAATLGAVCGMWVSRHLLGHWVQRRFGRQLAGFNQHLHEQGYLYLVLVRMIPMLPYTLVNNLAGLTKVRLRTIAWTTAVGTLPGILIFTYAGRHLLSIQSIDEVLTPKVIAAFALLLLFVCSVIAVRLLLSRSKPAETEDGIAETA